MIELRAGGARVTIDPARGGRLASLSVDARELLLRPPSDDDRSIRWGCFLMAPWPGRLAGARLVWRDRTFQLPRTHGRHAIHGLGWDREWRVAHVSAATAELELDLAAAGWPMRGTVRERLSLEPGALRLEAEIHAGEAMPAALGWHPWFLRRGGARVRLDADAVLEVDRMLPTGRRVPVAGRHDLRDGPPLGDRRLDATYTGVRSPMAISWPDLELSLSFGPECDAAVIYTPRDVFCVEPQTAVPNAFATAAGSAAHVLEAGESLRSVLELRWS